MRQTYRARPRTRPTIHRLPFPSQRPRRASTRTATRSARRPAASLTPRRLRPMRRSRSGCRRDYCCGCDRLLDFSYHCPRWHRCRCRLPDRARENQTKTGAKRVQYHRRQQTQPKRSCEHAAASRMSKTKRCLSPQEPQTRNIPTTTRKRAVILILRQLSMPIAHSKGFYSHRSAAQTSAHTRKC